MAGAKGLAAAGLHGGSQAAYDAVTKVQLRLRRGGQRVKRDGCGDAVGRRALLLQSGLGRAAHARTCACVSALCAMGPTCWRATHVDATSCVAMLVMLSMNNGTAITSSLQPPNVRAHVCHRCVCGYV